MRMRVMCINKPLCEVEIMKDGLHLNKSIQWVPTESKVYKVNRTKTTPLIPDKKFYELVEGPYNFFYDEDNFILLTD